MTENKTRPVPDWLLERLARNELPAAQAAALRAQLAAAGEDDRLAALERSNAEILAAHPAPAAAAEIARRLARPRPTPARANSWLMFAAPALAAAAVAIFVGVRGPGIQTPLPPADDETITLKGDAKPHLRIYRRTADGPERLADGAKTRAGDTLHVRYLAGGKTFGVVASVDARGKVTLHLPETPGSAAPLSKDGERALPHSFELDDSPGFERFVFATSDTPFDTAAVERALRGEAAASDVSFFSLTLTKETP